MMPRARNIKPAFFKNELLVELPIEARLLFIGLWTLADREGRLENRPKRIKMEIYPCDNFNIEELLRALHNKGFIQIYGEYIQVVNFTKHQSPHVKETASIIPAPDQHQISTVQAPDQHPLNPESLILKSETPILNPESSPNGKSEGDAKKPVMDIMAVYNALSIQQAPVDQFEEFWEQYGIKEGKDKCKKKYATLLKGGVKHEDIILGVKNYQQECVKQNRERQYIKKPLTFLNGGHWEDDYTNQQQNGVNKNGNNNQSFLAIQEALARL